MVKFIAILVFVFVFVLNKGGLCRNSNVNDLKKEILEQIISKDEIDVLIPPGNLTGGPMVVEVFISVLNIENFNPEKMEITYTLLLRQVWNDYRLRYDSKKQFDLISINKELHMIWTPDMYLPGVKKSIEYDVPNPNVFARIYPNGTVISSKRIRVTRECIIDLSRFPFDNQVCRLAFTLYGSTTSDIVLKWKDNAPVTFKPNLYLSLFTLRKMITSSKVSEAVTGRYSVLNVDFLLSRNFSHYLTHHYILYTMLIILSWISFWINKKSLSLRLTICLTSLVTLVLINYDVNQNLPKLSYPTSLDCFSGTCLAFIFSSIIAHVLVSLLEERKCDKEVNCLLNGDAQGKQNGKKNVINVWIAKISNKTDFIDLGAKIAYPVLYVIYCLIYYLVNRRSEEEQ